MRILTSLILAALLLSRPASAAGLFDHVGEGTVGAFTEENKWIWFGGTVLTLAAFNYDQQIYRHYADQEKEELPDSVGDIMGTGVPGATIGLLTLGTGALFGSERISEAGKAHLEALLATFSYTAVLKLAVERDRPPAFSTKESAFNASFPSAHTSTAFATAGSLMASAGPVIGLPVLALAALTGYSRIQQRAHYTGDVIFCATLGYTMGTGFYKHHRKGGRLASLQIWPVIEDRNHWMLASKFTF